MTEQDSWQDDKPITPAQYAGVWDSAMVVQEKPSYSKHIVRKLLTEIDRLGGEIETLLEEKAAKFVDATTMFRGLTVRDGQAHLEIEPAREMILAWCASVRAMLDEHQAENYTETELEMPRQDLVSLDIQDGKNPTDSYTLTLQRRRGKTPHQLRQQAERERDDARAELAEMRGRIAGVIVGMPEPEAPDNYAVPAWYAGYEQAVEDAARTAREWKAADDGA